MGGGTFRAVGSFICLLDSRGRRLAELRRRLGAVDGRPGGPLPVRFGVAIGRRAHGDLLRHRR
eukprot:8891187-Pyramimonas_sp.AAC.1